MIRKLEDAFDHMGILRVNVRSDYEKDVFTRSEFFAGNNGFPSDRYWIKDVD